MATRTYNKLVRDRIPDIIEKNGKKTVTEILDDTTYKRLLSDKLKNQRKNRDLSYSGLAEEYTTDENRRIMIESQADIKN